MDKLWRQTRRSRYLHTPAAMGRILITLWILAAVGGLETGSVGLMGTSAQLIAAGSLWLLLRRADSRPCMRRAAGRVCAAAKTRGLFPAA